MKKQITVETECNIELLLNFIEKEYTVEDIYERLDEILFEFSMGIIENSEKMGADIQTSNLLYFLYDFRNIFNKMMKKEIPKTQETYRRVEIFP